MNKIRFGSAVLLFCILLSGCSFIPERSDSAKTTPNKRENISFIENQCYAVAYLGYQQIDDFDFYVEHYLDQEEIPIHYLSTGDYYLVIPRYDGMRLFLFQNDIETAEPVLIFEDPNCQPFILQCNASDIFADATIRLSYEGGISEFSPFISLKDGELDIGPNGLDITKSSE